MYSVELYSRVRRACHVDGMSKSAAARHFGIDRKTVSKILKHAVPPGYRRFKWLKDDRYAPAVDVVPEADGPVFLPVGIEASASVDPAVTSTPSGRIEIGLSNGHRIIAEGGFDADMLARLLKGLSS